MDFTCFQFLSGLFYVSNMTILIGLFLFKFFLVPLSSQKRVYPPQEVFIHQGQLISFHFGVLELFLQQETKKKGQHDCNEKEKTQL